MVNLTVTNAADYARLEATEHGECVQMPSGAVFRMKRADFDGLLLTGAVPQSLLNTGMKAWKEQGKLTDDMLDQVVEQAQANPEETIKDLIFMRELVRENVLEPRIGYDEAGSISLIDDKGQAVTRLKSEDFLHAFSWISGQEGYRDNLERFRSRRERRATNANARKQKSKRSPESVPAN